MTHWKLIPFSQLTNIELYQLLKLRVDVFVVEQNCPYPELDGNDTLMVFITCSVTKEKHWSLVLGYSAKESPILASVLVVLPPYKPLEVMG